MTIREQLRRFREQVKEALGSRGHPNTSTSSSPGAQSNPITTPPLAHSHPPGLLSVAFPPHIESRVENVGGDEGSGLSNIRPASGLANLGTRAAATEEGNQAGLLNTYPLQESRIGGQGETSQPTCLPPDARFDSPMLSHLKREYEPGQLTKRTLEPLNKSENQGRPITTSALDPQATLPAVPMGKFTHSNLDRPTTPIPTPSETALNLSESTWKCFNRFRQVLAGISGGLGPLSSVMGELGGIIPMYEHEAEARLDYMLLKTELEGLFNELSVRFSGNVSPKMTMSMSNICAAIKEELDRITSKERRQIGRRYLEANKDLNEVMQSYKRIQAHLERLKLNADLSIWTVVDELTNETRLKSLVPSMSACYNSAEALQLGRRECTPETRKQVLTSLDNWRHDKTQEKLYWLSGMAGTGKTTIASSLCSMLDKTHDLGASFFCTRLLPECRNVKLIFPTIAYQLARFSRPFYHALSISLQADPDLHTKALPLQFRDLIVGPLREAALSLPEDLVVVIDALDECEDSQGVGLLLEVLVRQAPDLPVKIFISSRPEVQIRRKIGDTQTKLILHELEGSIVKEDIKLYLKTELKDLSSSISDNDLATLVERAGVLFIYAATVVRYIQTATSAFRQKSRIRAVLEADGLGSSRANNDIDTLYSTILASVFDIPDLDGDESWQMRLVLNTVVCAQEPLKLGALAGLLGLSDADLVRDALEPLWSVIHISGSDGLVTTLHASFPEFMLDLSRSGRYGCEPVQHHGRLAELCFDRVDNNGKQFNICGLETSYIFDEQVPDLDKRVRAAIPQDLGYACQYWVVHLNSAGSSTRHLHRLSKFMENRLLLWMEVLNLNKQMHLGTSIFEMAESWCKRGNASEEIINTVHDAWRFVTMFATNDVSRSTVHLYTSMLASWPKMGLLSQFYLPRAHGLAKLGGSGMAKRHLAMLGVLNTGARVYSVAFSPDGGRIASGSHDRIIRVWDAQTGNPLLDPLEGHTDRVNSVAFSPDGRRIVSGSADKTLRIWDAQTGKLLITRLESSESVNAVGFSPDGKHVVSGCDDRTIRLWDAQTGNPLLAPFQGHSSGVTSITFSTDGMRIASGSKDKSVRIWDAQTGELALGPLQGNTYEVNSVAFSSGGTRVASGGHNGTIRVWDAQTGVLLLGPLRHSGLVNSVAFSPNGMQLISGAYDNTIHIWDTQTGELLLSPLKGHISPVTSVAFSPDGMRIVSGSYDYTVRIWDAQAADGPLTIPLEGHGNRVHSVAFSPSGTNIVSGSGDCTVRTWDAQTGTQILPPLRGHIKMVTTVAFSPDGTRIVSGSMDRTVRVWDAQTGKPLLVLPKLHTRGITSVVFSPDGTRIASGAGDNAVRVWDVQSDRPLLFLLKGHTDAVNSVSFSPQSMHIATGSSDTSLRIWNAQTGKQLPAPFTGHTSEVTSVMFSPNGLLIVSGSNDKTVRMWDAQTGRPVLEPFCGHDSEVNSVAFSLDGARVVSGSYDYTIRVWDSQTGNLLFSPFNGHTGRVRSVGFSPDGNRVVSSSYDRTIRVWNAEMPIIKPNDGRQLPHSRAGAWVLDKHGWVVDERQRLLLWVPPDLRDRLIAPNLVCIVSTEGSVSLDFTNVKRGESWSECYAPCPCV